MKPCVVCRQPACRELIHFGNLPIAHHFLLPGERADTYPTSLAQCESCGLLQLGAGLRRRKQYGAQWAMMLSGAQSALAGAVFVFQAQAPAVPSIATVAGYAGFGAFYFLVSAISTSITIRRKRAAGVV